MPVLLKTCHLFSITLCTTLLSCVIYPTASGKEPAFVTDTQTEKPKTHDAENFALSPEQKRRQDKLAKFASPYILQYRILLDSFGAEHTHVKKIHDKVLSVAIPKTCSRENLQRDLSNAFAEYQVNWQKEGITSGKTRNSLRRIAIASRLLQANHEIDVEYIDKVILDLY